MKRIIATIAAFILSVSALAAASPSQQAPDAARNWLALIDAGHYGQSWNEASQFFRSHVTRAQWTTEAKAVRQPLGAVKSRSAPAVHFATSLPGAPDGHYAIVQFHSTFERKAAAVETVTMMVDGGTWKAAGYFIK